MTARTASRVAWGLVGTALLWLMVTGAPRDAQAAADIIKTSPRHIALEVREGSLIRLDRPASNVFIADPDVADVQIKSPTLIYVFGKSPGETSLYALGNDDKVLFSGLVSVGHDVTRLKEALHLLLPASDVKATSFDGSVILSGHVPSPKAAEDAQRIASKFLGKGDLVMNYLTIDQPNQVNLRVRVAEVSREVVKQLGFNWQNMVSGADYAVATSGIAGPDGGTPEKPVGTVCIAVAGPDGVTPFRRHFPVTERDRNKALFAMTALDALRRTLAGLPVGS